MPDAIERLKAQYAKNGVTDVQLLCSSIGWFVIYKDVEGKFRCACSAARYETCLRKADDLARLMEEVD